MACLYRKRYSAGLFLGKWSETLNEAYCITGSTARELLWSPNDKELWLVGNDNVFYAYSTDDFKPIEDHPLRNTKFAAIAITPDAKDAAFVSVDGEVKVLRLAIGLQSARGSLNSVKTLPNVNGRLTKVVSHFSVTVESKCGTELCKRNCRF